MSLILKSSGDFENPEEGTYVAVCSDVIDLGRQVDLYKENYNVRHKVRISFLIEATMSDGRNFQVSTYPITFTSSTKGKLRPLLQGWRGADLTDKEMDAFDVEGMIGEPASIVVGTKIGKDGRKWSNIISVSPVDKRLADAVPTIPDDYERWKERSANAEQLVKIKESFEKSDQELIEAYRVEHETGYMPAAPLPASAEHGTEAEAPF